VLTIDYYYFTRTCVDATLDRRMARMPGGQGFRLFKDGITALSHMKAQDYRHLMPQMMFAVHGLFDAFDTGDDITAVFVAHAEWYSIARQTAIDEDELTELQRRLFRLNKSLEIFKEQVSSDIY
jgi:hypothetical protein